MDQDTFMSRTSPPSRPGLAQLCRRSTFVLALVAAPHAIASDGAPTDDGLALAKTHCGRCHIVSEADRFAGISSTPSFKIMIEALPDWAERFDTFMARNPHPAHIRFEGDAERPENLPVAIKEVILTPDEVAAIRAYIDHMAAELGKR